MRLRDVSYVPLYSSKRENYGACVNTLDEDLAVQSLFLKKRSTLCMEILCM